MRVQVTGHLITKPQRKRRQPGMQAKDIKAISDKRDPCKLEIKGLIMRHKLKQTPVDNNKSSLE